ncbi:MAG: acetyl-CoA carboxylase biotin carboxylase subunit [Limnochordia bacterium]|nr:acetyl-CoA carboxylase biotin carboxylase subunit [Limnochordia bacterium]
MFERILVANRGEIALRVIRACREMGISTVAVYSEADQNSLHVHYADEAYCIGPPPSAKSYLSIPNIISAAMISGCDAIHPGYGALSENPQFAEICQNHGLTFIGPSVKCMESMGDKAVAKQLMQKAGVPVVPGSEGPVVDEKEAIEVAENIGYPVIIKAASGGGGKGMRIARSADEVKRMLNMARIEAEAAFGSGEVYIEKLIEGPRHIEVQILADEFGRIIHLGERECSIQRRHQKIIEESPSPAIDEGKRKQLGEAAILGAKAVGYSNAGTMEFLYDRNGDFYFMEMNTRIQVEHPITEMVTGVDLVKEQIRIAAGQPLRYRQEDIKITGVAIECRLNAEDPDHNFRPCPGLITDYLAPGGPGIRVDSAAYPGWEVTPYYDSMFGKLIAWAPTRHEAINRAKGAIDEFIIEGIKTNLLFHLRVLDNDSFVRGELSTDFVEKYLLRSSEED